MRKTCVCGVKSCFIFLTAFLAINGYPEVVNDIVVNNASFEIPSLPTGSFQAGAPTDWIGSAAYGSNARVGTLNASNELQGIDGNNVSVLITYPLSGLSFIYQDIPTQMASIQAGTFTLEVKVAKRTAQALPDTYKVDFRSLRGTTQTTITPTSISNPSPSGGNTVVWTQTYQFDSSSPYLGDAIRIVLWASGSSGASQSQVVFDKVQLRFVSNAAYVGISNPSFEDPTITSSPYESATVNGWQESGNVPDGTETASIWRAAHLYPGLTKGANLLLLRVSTNYPTNLSGVWQNVSTIVPGTYTLKAVVGRRDKTLAFIPNLMMSLYAWDGTNQVLLPADVQIKPTPAPNTFVEWVHSVTIPSGSEHIGKQMRIFFGGSGDGGGSISYAMADHFRLEFEPEQTTPVVISCEPPTNFPLMLNTSDQFYPTFQTSWQFHGSKAEILNISDTQFSSYLANNASLMVKNGRTNLLLTSKCYTLLEQDDTSFSTLETFEEPYFTIRHNVNSQNSMINWHCELTNLSDKEIWIELAWMIPFAFSGDFHCWNGHTLIENTDQLPFEREEMKHTFPVSTVYDRQKGLAIGVAPNNLISYLKSSFDSARRYTYAVRFAIPPSEQSQVDFVFFTFHPHYGYYDAIYGYQQRFPQSFSSSEQIDPRIKMSVDTLGMSRIFPSMQNDPMTIASRGQQSLGGYGTVDWGYAPFKRAGDWFGRQEYWTWPMTADEEQRILNRSNSGYYNLLDLNQFHYDRLLQWNIANYRYNNVIIFYLINWMEENLVWQLNPLDHPYVYENLWGRARWITGTSFEFHMYPWASVLESTFRRDLPDLVNELNLSAFGLDNASNNSKYRGPLNYYLAGWAYDQEGKFINTGIGHKKLIDYIHSLSNGRFKLAVIGNSGDPFMVATALDGSLLETRESEPYSVMRSYPTVRYLHGHKPIMIHSAAGYFNPALEISWQTLSSEQIKKFYQAKLNQYVMGCLEWGLMPNVSHVWGRESIAWYMPLLTDLIADRGFQQISGAVGDETLKRVRYGKGLSSAICYLNNTYSKMHTSEKILSAYFKKNSAIVPFDYFGKFIDFSSNKNETIIPLYFGSKQIKVIETPLSIEPVSNQSISISGSSYLQSQVDTIIYALTFETSFDGYVKLNFQPRKGYVINLSQLDNLPIQLNQEILLLPGVHTIHIVTKSSLFFTTEAIFLTFNYPDAVIVVGNNPTQRLAGTAQMLQDFFNFHQNMQLPIVAYPSENRPSIILQTGQPSKIFIDVNNQSLTISGSDDFFVQQNATELMKLLLRKKYNWIGDMFGWATRPLSPTYNMLIQAGYQNGQYFPKTTIDTNCSLWLKTDFNSDCKIDIFDLMILMDKWLMSDITL